MKSPCQHRNRLGDEQKILPWMPNSRPSFKIWVKPEQIAPLSLIPHRPYATSLLLKISDRFRAEKFRRLGLIDSSEDWGRLVRGVTQEFEENNGGVGLFHFDSDGDVFCVYPQYIDGLMPLAKMIRIACVDERTMWTYLDKIEYVEFFWEGAPEGESAVILYEVDTENRRLVHRPIDIFADGCTHSNPDLYDGAIKIMPIPTVEELNARVRSGEFHTYIIEQVELEAIWESYAYNEELEGTGEIGRNR